MSSIKRIAIDLTWIRHGKVGGTESSIVNLIEGLEEVKDPRIKIYLIVSKDNQNHIEKYTESKYFDMIIANVKSKHPSIRVIWQNLCLRRLLEKYNISRCLEPIYSIPFTRLGNIEFYSVIHDLQAIHYPEYFSILKRIWMNVSWKNSVKKSKRIIAISNYVKDDIIDYFNADTSKVIRIYDAIKIDNNIASDKEILELGLKTQKYYYTVSSMLPHKNLKTIIRALAEMKRTNSTYFYPLVVSGVGGSQERELIEYSKDLGILDDIIITGFVEDSIRNLLYKNCYAFLFPSIFEGFGMPPIEAMAFNVPVLTTKCTSLVEVTDNLVNYVDDARDYSEWIRKIQTGLKCNDILKTEELLMKYSSKTVALQYIELMLL
jgi:glycosyltransferase involved in cell wall biosynthesis